VALDGNASLAFQVHVIQHLFLHLPSGNGFGNFEQAVGKGAFAMIYMGYNAEIAYVLLFCHLLILESFKGLQK
jgi:hypothetical protein